MLLMVVTLAVLKLLTLILVKAVHCRNMADMSVTFAVLKLLRLRLVNFSQ